MYNRLLRLYKEKIIFEIDIKKAVALKWITQEECNQILK